jgi:hypothetical protein
MAPKRGAGDDEPTWTCGTCTLVNVGRRSTCVACESSRGSSSRGPRPAARVLELQEALVPVAKRFRAHAAPTSPPSPPSPPLLPLPAARRVSGGGAGAAARSLRAELASMTTLSTAAGIIDSPTRESPSPALILPRVSPRGALVSGRTASSASGGRGHLTTIACGGVTVTIAAAATKAELSDTVLHSSAAGTTLSATEPRRRGRPPLHRRPGPVSMPPALAATMGTWALMPGATTAPRPPPVHAAVVPGEAGGPAVTLARALQDRLFPRMFPV